MRQDCDRESSVSCGAASGVLERREIDEVLRLMPNDEDSELPLAMPLTPVMLQLAFILGVIDENHVSVQSLLRLLCSVFDLSRTLPVEVYAPLRAFDTTMYVTFGPGALYMQRGAGTSGATMPMTAFDVAASMNGGSFHQRIIRAHLPETDLDMGVASPCSSMNFIVAAMLRSKSVYSPGPDKQVIIALTSSDVFYRFESAV